MAVNRIGEKGELSTVLRGSTACEALFGMLCESGLNLYGQSMVRPDAVGKLLLRVYSQQRDPALQTRCLNLIDRMLQFGEYSLSQVLAEYDR